MFEKNNIIKEDSPKEIEIKKNDFTEVAGIFTGKQIYENIKELLSKQTDLAKSISYIESRNRSSYSLNILIEEKKEIDKHLTILLNREYMTT